MNKEEEDREEVELCALRLDSLLSNLSHALFQLTDTDETDNGPTLTAQTQKATQNQPITLTMSSHHSTILSLPVEVIAYTILQLDAQNISICRQVNHPPPSFDNSKSLG